ncbi:hypothetical protein LINPERHAP1_LOCUS3984 [Linum perenne]
MVWHKKIATSDNLQRRGLCLVNRCVLCERDLETVDHLLIHCDFTSAVWNRVSSVLSMCGPRNGEVRGLIESWKGMNCNSVFAEVARVLIHGVFWFTWLERNDRIFRGSKKNVQQVAVRILFNIGRWLAAKGLFSDEKLVLWHSFIFDPG